MKGSPQGSCHSPAATTDAGVNIYFRGKHLNLTRFTTNNSSKKLILEPTHPVFNKKMLRSPKGNFEEQ